MPQRHREHREIKGRAPKNILFSVFSVPLWHITSSLLRMATETQRSQRDKRKGTKKHFILRVLCASVAYYQFIAENGHRDTKVTER
jgi:hypothetical protein